MFRRLATLLEDHLVVHALEVGEMLTVVLLGLASHLSWLTYLVKLTVRIGDHAGTILRLDLPLLGLARSRLGLPSL